MTNKAGKQPKRPRVQYVDLEPHPSHMFPKRTTVARNLTDAETKKVKDLMPGPFTSVLQNELALLKMKIHELDSPTPTFMMSTGVVTEHHTYLGMVSAAVMAL